MSIFDHLLDPAHLWDSEHKQRRDIQDLRRELDAAPDLSRLLTPLAARVDQLELLCKALTELLVSKGVASPEELSVLAQQLDLADGVEDGKVSARVRDNAPRCPRCQRFANPRRQHCVYCEAELGTAVQTSAAPAPRTVSCGGCGQQVPESQTYYSGSGLRCERCYDPSDG
ncbi:MAG: hypothetical protein JKY37_01405 [Nannocystaceae bacterium]|nr:hypothetical protein [Nannocystaceae bacterium]